MSGSPRVLKVAIFDTDRPSTNVLKAIIDTKATVSESKILDNLNDLDKALQSGYNSVFIDIYALGVEQGLHVITHVRTTYPMVPICLYSISNQLIEMPRVDENWRKRFEHYFKLAKDQTPQKLDTNVEGILRSFGRYLEREYARTYVDDIASIATHANMNESQKREIAAIAEAVKKALQPSQDDMRSPRLATIVPGVDTGKVEELVNTTLKDATQSLRQTTNVNIGILVTGSILVFVSFIVAAVTSRWEAVAFGGFGTAGIIASLITNPLKSIGISARRLVQIQVAYLAFLSQLSLLNEESSAVSQIERSQQLGAEMMRTLKSLEEYFGK